MGVREQQQWRRRRSEERELGVWRRETKPAAAHTRERLEGMGGPWHIGLHVISQPALSGSYQGQRIGWANQGSFGGRGWASSAPRLEAGVPASIRHECRPFDRDDIK